MATALIGHTGFVGSNLNDQAYFDDLFNSSNVTDMEGKEYDTVVCAGVQAKKWWANQNEEADWKGIKKLLDSLKKVQAKKIILISTVDVYPKPIDVDEDTELDGLENHVYGKHRLAVEKFVQDNFTDYLIVRLPGLFGPRLNKNVIYDLIHDNLLEKINPNGVFQWYDLNDLWTDIQIAVDNDLKLVNFATEPIETSEFVSIYFPDKKIGQDSGPAGHYDFRSKYANIWKGENGYIRNKKKILERLGRYIGQEQSEL